MFRYSFGHYQLILKNVKLNLLLRYVEIKFRIKHHKRSNHENKYKCSVYDRNGK